MADLKDTSITGGLAVTGTANVGGATQISGDLTMYTSGTGDSPAVIFQRGTLTDNYNDWKIVDSGGQLKFQQRGLSSSSWTNEVSMSSAGDITATSFTGSGANITSINYNNISSNKPTAMDQTEATTGTATTARLITAKVLHDTIEGYLTANYENGNTSSY